MPTGESVPTVAGTLIRSECTPNCVRRRPPYRLDTPSLGDGYHPLVTQGETQRTYFGTSSAIEKDLCTVHCRY